MLDRIETIIAQHRSTEQIGIRLEQEAQQVMKQAFELLGDESNSESQKAKKILASLEMMSWGMDQMLSTGHAIYIDSLTKYAQRWAEIMEHIELHNWETSHRQYNYNDPSGFSVTLNNGWLLLDDALRKAVLNPGKHMPSYIKFVKIANLKEFGLDAIGEIYWDVSYNTQSPSLANAYQYWPRVDQTWRNMETSGGFQFANVNRHEAMHQNELILRLVGENIRNDGSRAHSYLGTINVTNGSAMMICTLPVDGQVYEICHDLFNGIGLPQ
jgi:hypothetical protein